VAKPLQIAITAATIWGNRGAEAMLTTTIGKVRERHPGSRFFVFSYSPGSDRALLQDPEVAILPSRPIDLVLVYLPASILCGLCNLIGLRVPAFLLPKSIRILRECDLLLDLAGISFVDGRELFLPFNILSIWPAMVQGTPVVKLAQAMGPFGGILNRRAAQAVLARCRHLYARGRMTMAYLDALTLTEDQKSLAADVGFLFREGYRLSIENEAQVAQLSSTLESIRTSGGRMIGLSPSSLVYEKARSIDLDYAQTFLDVVESLAGDSGRYEFVFIPNATRQGVDVPRNNDLFVIDEIRRQAAESLPEEIIQQIHWVDYDINTAGIRRILRSCEVLVTSRFHAMVAGLSLGIPTLVISWSHKYGEVLEAFELEQWEIGFDDPEMDVTASVRQLLAEKQAIQRKIGKKIDRIRSLAEAQFQDLERWLP
jgi:polysaccharide pyruvyl transferase WcaK-like protein